MKKTTKIVWLTIGNFLDVDIPIVNELSKFFDVQWIVVLRKTNYFTKDQLLKSISSFCFQPTIVNMTMRFRSIRSIFFYMKLIRLIQKQCVEIIYMNMTGMPYLEPLVKLFLPTKSVIYAVHDVEAHVRIKYRKIVQQYQKFLFKNFINFHVFSETQKKILTSRYPNKNVLYAPLFLKDFGTSDVKPDNDIITFLFFGGIRENKGLQLLIEAGNQLGENYVGKFKILICGKSDNWKFYGDMIRQNDVFELDIRSIPNEEIPELFLSSHYLVLPYLDVTQSGPLLIACNYNIPVVASNLPGFREYITDEETGYLFETENAKDLARVMKNLILNHNESCNIIKSNLKRFVEENISINAITNKYLTFFNSIKNENKF
jgi:glycosyltransferase involved in cell wall biosynthesis